MLYHLEDINKTYDGRSVLQIDSLQIEPERIYALSGPNGSGKSTLLNIMAFLTLPDRGQIRFHGRPVRYSRTNLRDIRKSVILVNQRPILFSTSVYKNVEFGLNSRRIDKKKRPSIVETALDLVGMRAFQRADARHLSGGETRRVAIAQALACSPEVLLLDEPTADLDPESRFTLEDIIRNIYAEKRTTIILSTHNPLQATRLSGNPIFLLDGRLRRTVYENIFSGTVVLSDTGQAFCMIREDVVIPIPDGHAAGKVKVSIRPEALGLTTQVHLTDRNAFSLIGRLVQLAEDGGSIRAVVDVGIPMNVRMEKAEYRERLPVIGQSVKLLFDPAAIRLLDVND